MEGADNGDGAANKVALRRWTSGDFVHSDSIQITLIR